MAEQENTQPESMEDILSSIRATVEEEASANETESTQAAASEEPVETEPSETAPAIAEDVDMDAVMDAEKPATPEETAIPEEQEPEPLDLSEMLEEDTEKTETEEVIDIAAFNATGEETSAEEEKAENARELYRGGEVSENITQPEPANEEISNEEAPEQEEEPVQIATETEQQIEDITKVATEVLAEEVKLAPTNAETVHLPTSPSADGLQVTFPVEVLAAALRPLVKDWVSNNLPSVVERLVKEELSKLANQ